MAQVVWSPAALRDLHGIELRAAKDRPMAAIRLGDRLWDTGESLREHPERGRPTATGLREIASVRPYLLRYRVRGDQVLIVEIRHSARRRKL